VLLNLFIKYVINDKVLISTTAKRISMKIAGVKDFIFDDLAHCTDDFSDSALIGQGGYGKVYRGVLADGTVVAIKRAQQGSLQGSKEFFTEIELLSRLHHRNLVSLLGYCDEEDEQVVPANLSFLFSFYDDKRETQFSSSVVDFLLIAFLELGRKFFNIKLVDFTVF
jgi:hypothetical protein